MSDKKTWTTKSAAIQLDDCHAVYFNRLRAERDRYKKALEFIAEGNSIDGTPLDEDSAFLTCQYVDQEALREKEK